MASEVQDALTLIESVHRLSDYVPEISIEFDSDLVEPGAFERRGDQVEGITLGPNTIHPLYTVVHEFGHFLDFTAFRGTFLPGPRYEPYVQWNALKSASWLLRQELFQVASVDIALAWSNGDFREIESALDAIFEPWLTS